MLGILDDVGSKVESSWKDVKDISGTKDKEDNTISITYTRHICRGKFSWYCSSCTDINGARTLGKQIQSVRIPISWEQEGTP